MLACENNFSDFFEEHQAAVIYYEEGKAAKDKDKKREGVFRIMDAWKWFTPISL